jgi:hypothetical protein
MDAQFLSRRLNDLEDHIDRDWGLLKEYEDLLRLTKDPKEKQSYLREIESLRASAGKYQVEREDLAPSTTLARADSAGDCLLQRSFPQYAKRYYSFGDFG